MSAETDERGELRSTVVRRIARETDSCTASFTRDDGQRFTVVGHGESLPQRYLAAVAQLPPGEYVCDAVSTPTTVYGDVTGRKVIPGWQLGGQRAKAGGKFNQYEGKRVCRS